MPPVNKVFLILFFAIFTSACNMGSGPVLIACGGASNFACPASMFCELGEFCGGIDKQGFCKPRPANCPLESEPVCGCDRKTYDNACWANIVEVTVLSKGPCTGK